VRSDGPDGIACWFIDRDYNEESFFVRHAYFLGANDPYGALKTTLKAEIDEEAWATLHSDTSRPFDKPKSGRIAVKVINHLGDEVMKVFRCRERHQPWRAMVDLDAVDRAKRLARVACRPGPPLGTYEVSIRIRGLLGRCASDFTWPPRINFEGVGFPRDHGKRRTRTRDS
jgi:hypothetical protein